MATKELQSAYREVRRTGDYTPQFNAIRSFHQAQTIVKWRAAAAAGFVRLDVEPDQDYDPYDFDPPEPGSAYGVVGRYRKDSSDMDDCYFWVQSDSVWGCIGYTDPADWKENPYVLDIMAATLQALAFSRKCV